MVQSQFHKIINDIVGAIGNKALDKNLEDFLNTEFPRDGQFFEDLKKICAQGEQEGWLVQHEDKGIKFGRIIKPGAEAGRFSVDVVRMKNIKGPHHIHMTGEIGAIMKISGDPKFDGYPEGWYVYGSGSDHYPTVSEGEAYVLYLLPDGKIEFTGR